MKNLANRSQELVIRPQVALSNAVFNRVDLMRRRREDGQTSIEYLGIIVLVGIIAVFLIGKGPEWAEKIATKIGETIGKVGGK